VAPASACDRTTAPAASRQTRQRKEKSMTDKPDLKLIEAAASDDPYDLARLRINPEMLETTSVKKLLTTVPMRKPGNQDFVRVHPSPQYRETFAFIELHEDRDEIYILDRVAVPELQGEIFYATLFTAITRTGVLFLWPVKVPAGDAKPNEWHVSAATAAQYAMKSWVRVKANMALRGYEVLQADSAIPDPEWPTLSFDAITHIAFKDRVIRHLDHPVIKRLRGG
jgi:hypothetical protein